MAYTIQINDEQRALMVRCIRALLQSNDELIIPEDEEELELLRDMLDDLPAQEAAEPGCTHGLCL